MARQGALWMGDLTEHMTESFILSAFHSLGEDKVLNVKVMKNRYTGLPAGYCFVNFSSDEAALTAMHKLNGKIVPGSQPQVRFKLNHSSNKGTSENAREFSLWVGDLTPDVDDFSLYKAFGTRYNSIKSAKVIYDPSGQSKGFAFVRFVSEDDYNDAMVHMNGYSGLGQKALKVSYAVPKKQQYPGMEMETTRADWNQMAATGDYSQYYDQYWNYNSWQGGSQASNNSGSGSGGYYSSSYTTNYGDYTLVCSENDSKDSQDEFESVEWNVEFDVAKANAEYIERSEELWTALERARWTFWSDLSAEQAKLTETAA